ncbi:MAG: hypothetical protein U0559_01395 [Anaerolineae bacterium]
MARSLATVLAALMGVVKFDAVMAADWVRVPRITFPAFENPNSWAVVVSVSLIAIANRYSRKHGATVSDESVHRRTVFAKLKRAPIEIKKLIGLNLIADGSDDLVVGFWRLRWYQLWREQQPDGNHCNLLGAGLDDGRRDCDLVRIRLAVWQPSLRRS